jgi:hypothetical protein
MTTLLQLRLALALIGIIIWGYGTRSDSVRLQWVGIGFLVLAFLARFLGPRPRRRGEPPPDEPEGRL